MAADSKRKRRGSGPQFLRYCIPIADALKEMGNSGSPVEVTDRVIEMLGVSEEEQAVQNKNGGSRVRNQVAWARFYMAKAELIDSSRRGIWGLTEHGLRADLTDDSVLRMFKDLQAKRPKRAKEKKAKERCDIADDAADTTADEEQTPDERPHRGGLLAILKDITPAGFERLCQRLLRESGFERVVVTGKSRDGGIDGIGVLEVNAFVTFNVLFQCKRYKDSVGSATVRDFRGAMAGRADKGIILTTGAFTVEARKEARRDGVPPIELVDGAKLVELFENLELGLKPKTIYEVDDDFFEEYRTD